MGLCAHILFTYKKKFVHTRELDGVVVHGESLYVTQGFSKWAIPFPWKHWEDKIRHGRRRKKKGASEHLEMCGRWGCRVFAWNESPWKFENHNPYPVRPALGDTNRFRSVWLSSHKRMWQVHAGNCYWKLDDEEEIRRNVRDITQDASFTIGGKRVTGDTRNRNRR